MEFDGPSLTLLGAFAIVGVQAALPLPTRRLLAFLALQGEPVHRQFAAYSLWPDAREIRARTSLRTAVWAARRAHGQLIETDGTLLSLGVGVDVDFRSLVRTAKQLAASGTDLNALIEPFSRELLPDWYEDWVLATRDRWREVRLRALEMIAHELIKRDELDGAIDAGRRAVAIDPLRETSRTAVIRAYLAEGNIGSAVGEHRSFATLLRRELSVRPSPILERLMAPFVASRIA